MRLMYLGEDRHAWCRVCACQERLSGVREELIPIDHGFCLPEALESPYLEWLFWPQARAPQASSHSLPCMHARASSSLRKHPTLHGHGC